MMHSRVYIYPFIFLTNMLLTLSFIDLNPILLKIPAKMTLPLASCSNCGERTIYRNYLLGLRKTRKLLNNTSNVNTLSSIVNFTSEFIGNHTNQNDTIAKNIIMGNVILDVSNVKEIHIHTEKDVLIIELDKRKQDLPISNINNIDTLLTSISLIGKILNINP